jgi:undecaprenyl-diphosphatase
METALAELMEWTRANPNWAGMVVLVVSALESFLVVGLFVPGSVVMFGIGAMIAAGHMELVPTLAWATVGAVLGDGTSYLIGRYYHQRLRVMWPFRKYPHMIARGVDFFHKHGGKSIILARFVGPVRPLVPAVAGMLDMPASRFFVVNILSALVWAPAYILPGMLFGASLGLAAEVAGRLAALLVILLILMWLSWWLMIRIARSFQAHAQSLQTGILEWSRRHPSLEPLAAALLDPNHPEARGMSVLTGILLIASLALLLIPQHLAAEGLFGNLDLYLFNLLQELRSPFGDRLLVITTELGSRWVLYSFTALLSLWLLWRRRWRAALHWLLTVGFVSLLTDLLKVATQVQRPPVLDTATLSYSFPSGHASVSVAVFGFLAVMIARELRSNWHWIPYSLAVFLVVAIGFSRLYLGAHWLSDVLAGWSLGLVWVALMGIAYRQHPAPAISIKTFGPLCLAALLLTAGAHSTRQLEQDLAFYRPSTAAPVLIRQADWLAGGWVDLPAYRDDLEGLRHHPFNVQWMGSATELQSYLERAGWRKPRIAHLAALVELFNSAASIRDFPVLPQIHQGETQDIVLVRDSDDPARLLALRLWKTSYRDAVHETPLWIGNVSYLYVEKRFRLLRFPRTEPEFGIPLDLFKRDLKGVGTRWVERRPVDTAQPPVQWDNRVVLIYSKALNE